MRARLALLHEDMHHEAALYMARALGLPVHDSRWRMPLLPEPGPALQVAASEALTTPLQGTGTDGRGALRPTFPPVVSPIRAR